MSDENPSIEPESPVIDEREDLDTVESRPERAPQYGVGPFSIREVVLVGIWALAFIFSFFSLSVVGFASVWTSGLLWVLTIGVPTVAVFLVVLRRLSPLGIRRVGSLGIDQFASVAFSVAAVLWLQMVWDIVAFTSNRGPWVHSWVPWAELVLMLAGVAVTVFAPLLPVMREDFDRPEEIPAHRNARPLRPVSPRPVRERPAREDAASTAGPAPAGASAPEGYAPATPYAESPADPYAPASADPYAQADPYAEASAAEPVVETADADASQTAAYDTGGFTAFVEQMSGTAEPETELLPTQDAAAQPAAQQPAAASQPFWALAPEERDVLDESGAPLFTVGPTAWALVIEDRGEAFVIRHEDGRIGYLHDVSGVTRG